MWLDFKCKGVFRISFSVIGGHVTWRISSLVCFKKGNGHSCTQGEENKNLEQVFTNVWALPYNGFFLNSCIGLL